MYSVAEADRSGVNNQLTYDHSLYEDCATIAATDNKLIISSHSCRTTVSQLLCETGMCSVIHSFIYLS